MVSLWLQFAGVLAAQAACLCFVGWWRRFSYREILSASVVGFALAVPLGLLFDLVAGDIWGVYTYTFGYGNGVFMFLNALLSFGLMQATVYFLKGLSLAEFILSVWVVAVIYEAANYLLPVWQWQLSAGFFLEEALIIFLAYPALALLMAIVWDIFQINQK